MHNLEALERTLKALRRPSPRRLREFLQEWGPTLELARPYIAEPASLPYGRTSLFRGEAAEVVLIHLPAGAETWIHDHGSSVGCALVLEGTVTNRIFELDAYGFPLLKKTAHVGRNEYLLAPKGLIHQMANEQPARAVSLHIYTPSMNGAKTYHTYENALDFVI